MIFIAHLDWPAGRPRKIAKDRRRGTYSTGGTLVSLAEANQRLADELVRHKAVDIELYADFVPAASGRVTGQKWSGVDPGAVVRYNVDRTGYCLPCDTFTELAQNIAGLAEYLKSVRKQEALGVATLSEMMTAFAALPAPPSWREIFGLSKTATLQDAESAYRRRALSAHPDNGGSDEAMQRLNDAIAQARKDLS